MDLIFVDPAPFTGEVLTTRRSSPALSGFSRGSAELYIAASVSGNLHSFDRPDISYDIYLWCVSNFLLLFVWVQWLIELFFLLLTFLSSTMISTSYHVIVSCDKTVQHCMGKLSMIEMTNTQQYLWNMWIHVQYPDEKHNYAVYPITVMPWIWAIIQLYSGGWYATKAVLWCHAQRYSAFFTIIQPAGEGVASSFPGRSCFPGRPWLKSSQSESSTCASLITSPVTPLRWQNLITCPVLAS